MGSNSTNYAVPISCKGIVFESKKVWLRLNERGEWELPGGKLESGEQPEAAVAREMLEELGVKVNVGSVIANYLYTVRASFDEAHGVFVAMYMCELAERVGDVEKVGEAGPADFKQFAVSDLDDLPMPVFYKQAIRRAATTKA